MTDYALLNKMVRRHKSALTRAKNSGDPQKVIVACERARDDFNTNMWPDAWPTWNIAYRDAQEAAGVHWTRVEDLMAW